ncbi:hypothetical protein [uncultured Microbacterium sp.]|uniref:hypothetical protein n=1 Tax=uncultured Microbacterium sp. TaxID=191216 RepID=UPI0025DA41C8|nr:hypothetical protein [uncultured Microbacterium sp.]
MNQREQLIEKAARILWAEDDSEIATSWLNQEPGEPSKLPDPRTLGIPERPESDFDIATGRPLGAEGVQGEPSDAGVGWFEWFKMPENTTEIAYVHENGEVFDPTRGWNPPEFVIAAAEGRVHRLVRAAATEGGER